MRIDIRKFGVGGPSFAAVPNPFLQDPVVKQTNTDATELVPDEVMNSLMKTGIPSDVDKFMSELAQFEHDADFGLGVSKSKIYALKAKANRVVQASNYLKEAEKQAQKNGALDEVAVDANGYFFTTDEEGKISKTSMKDFDPSKQMALTVGQLLETRKYSPQLADNTNVATVVGSSVGIEKINSYIKGIINTIGSSSSVSEAYVDLATMAGRDKAKRPTEAQYQAIQGIMNEWDKLGPDAIFKDSEKLKSKNVKDALNYILSVLPDNMKNQLYGRYVAAGGDINDAKKHAEQIIVDALNMGNDVEQESKFKFENQISTSANPSARGGKTFYQTPNEAFLDGDLNQTTITITDNAYGNQSFVDVKGVTMPGLTTDKGQALSNLPLGVALSNSLLKYTDRSKMYMGEQKINEGMLNNIAYSGEKVAAIYMPVTSSGDIDWDGFHAFSQAQQYIRENDIKEIDQKNMIHARFGSYAYFDKDGSLKTRTDTARYMLTYGYTIDDHISDGNQMVQELTDQEESDADALISQIYNKHLKNTTGVSGMGSKNFWDDIFKVPIFIKMDDTASMDSYRYGGHGSNMTPRTLEEDMTTQMAQQTPNIQVSGNTNLLYQE